jgi:4-amino-4-deoxy-L-arabinose transferase-like glycosyltransferase
MIQTRQHRLARWLYDNRVDIAIITAITLLAAVLRIWRVGTVPLGLHGDEAWTGLDARRVLREGWIGAYVPSAVGQPTGPLYFTALLFKFMPQTTFTLRFSMALFGVGTIPLMYATFSAMFNRTVAAFSSLFLAVMMWHLHLSRTGFMVIAWPFAEMAVLLALWHAMRLRSLALFALAGALTGVGVYTYNAYYLFIPLPFVAFAWTYAPRRAWSRRTLLHVGGFVVAAVVVSLPMLSYIAGNYTDYRFHQKLVSLTGSEEWRQADGFGEQAHLIWDRADELQGALLHGNRPDFGDGLATSGHPPLGQLMGGLAAIGFLVALWNWRKASYAVVLSGVALIPWGALLTVGDGLFRRTLGITPFVALLAALPPAAAWERVLRWPGRARYAAALLLLLPASVGVTTTYQYFGPVQDDPAFRATYPYPMDAASHYIASLPKGTFVYFVAGNWRFDYETRRFIAPDAIGVDRSREFRDRSRDPTPDPIDFSADRSGDVAFVLLAPYLDDLGALTARYPGGTLTEVSRGAELLFRGYFLPRKE